MRVTAVPFSLLQWRQRMHLTQVRAADALGMSLNGYCSAEYRNSDRPGHPCNKTVALLADRLEEDAHLQAHIAVQKAFRRSNEVGPIDDADEEL